LLETETVAALDVALLNDTVHLLDVPLLRRVGEQTRPINWTGATRLNMTDFVVLPDAAVITLVWSAFTCTAVAVKLTDIDPAGMVMLKGTVRFPLLLDSAIASPTGVGEVRESVHNVFPGVITVLEAQPSPLSIGCRDNEIVPEAPLAAIELPAAVAATTLVI
jgi:hypothetical protein